MKKPATNNPTERSREALTSYAKSDQPSNEQCRRDCDDIERKHLDDQRGPDICAQHDRECRHEAHNAIGRK